jgi:hypothetical protein
MATVQDVFTGELRRLGWPEHAIQGVAMNANSESGWNPTIPGDNGNAYGLLQWAGPRRKALVSFAAANGMDPGDPVLQARFLHHEGQTNEKGGGGDYMGKGVTMSSRGGGSGPLGWMHGDEDEDFAIAQGLDIPEQTWRDRLKTALVGGGELLGDLGAGHATNFRSTDAFLAGEEERRINRATQGVTAANTNQSIAWLDRLGPEFADLADLARSGDVKSATEAALKRKAEMDKAALEGGGSTLPEGIDKDLYKSGQHLGQINRNLQSLEGLLIEMDKAIADGDTEKFRALKEAAQTVENDFKAGMGNYQSFGNEPNQASLDQGGLGIPADLVSEKELNEILNTYKGDFPGMAVALLQKYPDLAPYLGGALGAKSVDIGGGGGVVGALTGVAGEAAGAAGGVVAGNWLKDFLEGESGEEGARKFNQLRINQAKLRLARTGQRIQGEMRVVSGQMPGQDFNTIVGQPGWDKYVYGARDPSDPDGWGN